MDNSRVLKTRARNLRRWLDSNELDAAVFLKEELESFSGNFAYYGGAGASEEYAAIIVDSKGGSAAIAHEYSFERMKSSGLYSRVYEIRQSIEELVSTLKNVATDQYPNKRIAFDLTTMKADTYWLMRKNDIRIPPNELSSFVYSERATKDEYEVEEMKKAVNVAGHALERTIAKLKEGESSKSIAKRIGMSIIEEGGVGTSFGTDVRMRRGVTEGEAHKLKRGDLVLFDFGAKLDSLYLSDVGRTIPFGMTGRAREFLNDVVSIKKEGLSKIRSGMSGNEVRFEIDKMIEEHGYLSTHRPGHQIGLNVHEPFGPNLAFGRENSLRLKRGMVLTWEPGIGLGKIREPKNRFGLAHMEDMVLIDSEPRLLGNMPIEYW